MLCDKLLAIRDDHSYNQPATLIADGNCSAIAHNGSSAAD
jgi:hypothetical protein